MSSACNCKDIWQIFCSELRRTAPTVIVWAALALGLSYYNSWLLQDPTETGGEGHPAFTFPILYTLCQTVTQVIAIGCVFMFASDTIISPSCSHFLEHWALLLVFAAVRLVQIGGEAWALTDQPLIQRVGQVARPRPRHDPLVHLRGAPIRLAPHLGGHVPVSHTRHPAPSTPATPAPSPGLSSRRSCSCALASDGTDRTGRERLVLRRASPSASASASASP